MGAFKRVSFFVSYLRYNTLHPFIYYLDEFFGLDLSQYRFISRIERTLEQEDNF